MSFFFSFSSSPSFEVIRICLIEFLFVVLNCFSSYGNEDEDEEGRGKKTLRAYDTSFFPSLLCRSITKIFFIFISRFFEKFQVSIIIISLVHFQRAKNFVILIFESIFQDYDNETTRNEKKYFIQFKRHSKWGWFFWLGKWVSGSHKNWDFNDST